MNSSFNRELEFRTRSSLIPEQKVLTFFPQNIRDKILETCSIRQLSLIVRVHILSSEFSDASQEDLDNLPGDTTGVIYFRRLLEEIKAENISPEILNLARGEYNYNPICLVLFSHGFINNVVKFYNTLESIGYSTEKFHYEAEDPIDSFDFNPKERFEKIIIDFKDYCAETYLKFCEYNMGSLAQIRTYIQNYIVVDGERFSVLEMLRNAPETHPEYIENISISVRYLIETQIDENGFQILFPSDVYGILSSWIIHDSSGENLEVIIDLIIGIKSVPEFKAYMMEFKDALLRYINEEKHEQIKELLKD